MPIVEPGAHFARVAYLATKVDKLVEAGGGRISGPAIIFRHAVRITAPCLANGGDPLLRGSCRARRISDWLLLPCSRFEEIVCKMLRRALSQSDACARAIRGASESFKGEVHRLAKEGGVGKERVVVVLRHTGVCVYARAHTHIIRKHTVSSKRIRKCAGSMQEESIACVVPRSGARQSPHWRGS